MTPWQPMRPCAEPGCGTLVSRGRCALHERPRRGELPRPTAARRGYGRHHQAWRRIVLAMQPVCLDPDGRHAGEIRAAEVADHVVPLRLWAHDAARAARELCVVLARRGVWTDPDELSPWSYTNGAGLCVSCHNAKAQRERELSVELVC